MDVSKIISKSDALLLLELINECVSCCSAIDIEKVIQGLKKILNIDNIVYALAKLNNDGSLRAHTTWNISYPEEWLDLYEKKAFYNIDPIVKENFTYYKLQFWADTFKKWPCPKDFISMAESFNLKNGYTFGTRNHKKSEGNLISLAGEFPDCERNKFVIGTLAHHLLFALSSIENINKEKKFINLSSREKEVLNWIKMGKSSWDISVILSISERTVKFHVNNIMNKLDAVSRTHAVVIALSEGLIEVG